LEGIQIILAPHVLVPLPKHVEGIPQDLVALEFRLRPIRRDLFDLERLAILEVLAQTVYSLPKNAIALPFGHLKRTHLVDEIVNHIAQVHRVEHSKAEIDREL